jgi:hypothetical protein
MYRFLAAAARVQAQVRSSGICGVKWNWGGFLRVLRFPLPILISLTAPNSSSFIRGWYNRPVSGRRTEWTQSHRTQRNVRSEDFAAVVVKSFLGYNAEWFVKNQPTFRIKFSKRALISACFMLVSCLVCFYP